jgi:hypothetical protein
LGHPDLTGLAIAIAVGGAIAALGVGVDSLLLRRHAEAANELALRWWDFFDNLRIADIPRIAVSVYIRGKNRVLGTGFTPMFFVRSFLLSLLLTTITVPGGRALGLALLLNCNARMGQAGPPISLWRQVQIGWDWTGVGTLTYLVPVNVAFDLATIFITIIILSKALSKPDYFLISLILVDIGACFVLFYNAVYIADRFDSASMISATGYLNLIPSFIAAFSFGCTAFHVLTSKLLFISTILLPTLIYLIMIVGLFVLRESFKLFKFFAMYLLEKSVEDQKTIFAHLGTTVGLLVAIGKASEEVAKLL